MPFWWRCFVTVRFCMLWLFFLVLCCWGWGCPAGHVCRVLAARPASIAGGRGGGALFWVFTVRRHFAAAALSCLQLCLWLAWRFFTFDPSFYFFLLLVPSLPVLHLACIVVPSCASLLFPGGALKLGAVANGGAACGDSVSRHPNQASKHRWGLRGRGPFLVCTMPSCELPLLLSLPPSYQAIGFPFLDFLFPPIVCMLARSRIHLISCFASFTRRFASVLVCTEWLTYPYLLGLPILPCFP